jgi:predicted DsbA family dithiol-disulfide isomerase
VRIDTLQKEYEIQVKWVAFPLHPEIPEEGTELAQLFAGREVDTRAISLRLRQVARELGLPLGDRTRTFNTRLTQELGKWAESQGKGDEYHRAVFRAYFVDGANIGKPDELLGIAASLGLSAGVAREVMEKRTFREEVDADWTRSRDLGITGVPTFIMGSQRIVGAQPYDVLERFVEAGGKAKRRS